MRLTGVPKSPTVGKAAPNADPIIPVNVGARRQGCADNA